MGNREMVMLVEKIAVYSTYEEINKALAKMSDDFESVRGLYIEALYIEKDNKLYKGITKNKNYSVVHDEDILLNKSLCDFDTITNEVYERIVFVNVEDDSDVIEEVVECQFTYNIKYSYLFDCRFSKSRRNNVEIKFFDIGIYRTSGYTQLYHGKGYPTGRFDELDPENDNRLLEIIGKGNGNRVHMISIKNTKRMIYYHRQAKELYFVGEVDLFSCQENGEMMIIKHNLLKEELVDKLKEYINKNGK